MPRKKGAKDPNAPKPERKPKASPASAAPADDAGAGDPLPDAPMPAAKAKGRGVEITSAHFAPYGRDAFEVHYDDADGERKVERGFLTEEAARQHAEQLGG